VQPILDRWADSPPPEFPNYEAGSWGPKAADELIARERPGRRWRRP
jgi:glucose-6-phosphate 1-dehydrogenase